MNTTIPKYCNSCGQSFSLYRQCPYPGCMPRYNEYRLDQRLADLERRVAELEVKNRRLPPNQLDNRTK